MARGQRVSIESFGLGGGIIRAYTCSGWTRRRRDGQREPISGWRLVVHRILWGFHRLAYLAPPWTPFTADGRIDHERLATEGWFTLGCLSEEVILP